jgi:hypothetical protein
MPCGGISPGRPGTDDESNPDFGCFYCNKTTTPENPVDHFVEEWDAFLHGTCIDGFLAHDEGQVVLNHEHSIIRRYSNGCVLTYPTRKNVIGQQETDQEEKTRLEQQLLRYPNDWKLNASEDERGLLEQFIEWVVYEKKMNLHELLRHYDHPSCTNLVLEYVHVDPRALMLEHDSMLKDYVTWTGSSDRDAGNSYAGVLPRRPSKAWLRKLQNRR